MIDRIKAIETIIAQVREEDLVLSTTGMISRETFAVRDRPGSFYMLGSMGLLSAMGLGLAQLSPKQRVYVLEGDGSALMSLGTMPLIAAEAPPNLVHIVLDNESYESTGAQPTITSTVSLSRIASAAGYRSVRQAEDITTLVEALRACAGEPGPHFLLVKAGIAPVEEDIPRVSLSYGD